MPLLFAATLFVSASLLFMVQPMVGKMVLPLLGGSPAVWNACMVFFQLLLLLGYQYAHFVTGRYGTRKQWAIHLVVLALPVTAFGLAVALGTRHSPIAIVEALAPGGESSPVFSVLAILAVAIAVPFFVISTSAPLLQKWFTATGHPSARDPYFLYSASNAGSLISLLGYPFFIEPYLSIVGQAWVFAAGFVILTVMVFFCGRAAAHPIATPPPSAQLPANKGGNNGSLNGQNGNGTQVVFTSTELPPTFARKLKWILLAFVPSSLMLGVTFHMTTDIASIPLLWVGPLALYLITFIIAFGRVPEWFRVVIGNLAPVMILLLVFVMISGVSGKLGFGMTLLMHMGTFFAAALMCHYELARDRPSPKYLTEFFLLMSVGGVLGGIFNSLVAPLIFPHAYEYPVALVIACLLVPRLYDEDEEAASTKEAKTAVRAAAVVTNLLTDGSVGGFFRIKRWRLGGNSPAAYVLDIVIPILMGVLFYFLLKMPQSNNYRDMCGWIHKSLGLQIETINYIVIFALPVMICFFFVDRPLRFALCVAAILGYNTYLDEASDSIHSERSFFGILKIQEVQATIAFRKGETVFKFPDGKPMIAAKYGMRKLMHGTTLHGTQINYLPGPNGELDKLQSRHILDDFQMIYPGASAWDTLAVAGSIHAYDVRQEPLTYYHRTGPVGAMFAELRRRKGGTDAKAPFAMVGLGTGSASCYVLPGQKLTFYEIDPAVKHLVADTDKWFTFVTDGRNRAQSKPGGDLDIHMGDARLKLKEDVDRKYALLLVDAFSSDSIPVHLLTVEAVQLYLERLTDDGILALHISNRWVRLEPVVAAIADKLGLTARVWNDDSEGKLGKTASSWIVLARKPEHLGELYSPLGNLPFAETPAENGNDRMRRARVPQEGAYYYRPLIDVSVSYGLEVEYAEELGEKTGQDRTKANELDEAKDTKQAWLKWTERKYADVCDPDGSQRLAIFRETAAKAGTLSDYVDAYQTWFQEKLKNPETLEKKHLKIYIEMMRKYDPVRTLQDIMLAEHGHGFRRLEFLKDVHAWTDDYADVMRVMSIPELQKVRKFFGLPTPLSPN